MKYILLEYVTLVGGTLSFSAITVWCEDIWVRISSLLHSLAFISLLTGYLTGGFNNKNNNNKPFTGLSFLDFVALKHWKVSLLGMYFFSTSSSKRQRSWKLKLLCRYRLSLRWEVPSHLQVQVKGVIWEKERIIANPF